MRIRLNKGKQKDLILLAKDRMIWEELSKKIKIPKKYLCNDIKSERVLISKEVYKKLCNLAKKSFDEYIIEKLNDNWGKSKGGKLSIGKTKTIKIPKISGKLAEFYGIMLGDGNSNRTKGYKIGTYMIRIVGDIRHDYKYLIGYVKPLIEKLFDIRVKNGKFRRTNAMFIESHSLRLINFLETLGFAPGNKIKNQLTIPKWILSSNQLLKCCIRGLIDTDGSIFRMSKKDPNLLRISFTNYNRTLLTEVRNAFIRLGFKPSKIISNKQIFLSSKKDIESYLNEIGFSNLKHIERLRQFKNSPVV